VQEGVGDPGGVEDDENPSRQTDDQRGTGESGSALQKLLRRAVGPEAADETAAEADRDEQRRELEEPPLPAQATDGEEDERSEQDEEDAGVPRRETRRKRRR
jgi:hypothetical protein